MRRNAAMRMPTSASCRREEPLRAHPSWLPSALPSCSPTTHRTAPTTQVLNVGPEASNSHETLCSLRFASNVSQCDVGGKAKRSAKVAAVPERAAAPAASSAPSGSSGAATARPSTAGGKAPAAAGGRAPASGRPTTAPNKRQR